jgi:hypothetical protein
MYLQLNKMEVKSKVGDTASKVQTLDNWYQLATLGEKEFAFVCEFLSTSGTINGLSDIYTCTLKNFKYLFKSEVELFELKAKWYQSLINKSGSVTAEIKRYKAMARMAEHLNFLFFSMDSDGQFVDVDDSEVNESLIDKDTNQPFLLVDWPPLKFNQLFQTYKDCFKTNYKFHPQQQIQGRVAPESLQISTAYRGFLKEVEYLKKSFFPGYLISFDFPKDDHDDAPFKLEEKYFSVKLGSSKGVYKLGSAAVFSKHHDFPLLIMDIPQEHTEILDYNIELCNNLILDILESFVYQGPAECTAVVFVNVVQNGELSKGLKERGIWFKNGY